MGFYNLISARKLMAVYEDATKQLILYASGEVREATSGISFEQEKEFVGGLKFRLGGWTGPLTGKTSPYTHVQRFNITLPNPVINSKSVIIADADHPNGQEVPIEYIAAGQPLPIGGSAVEKAAATPVGNQHHITALYKKPFQIKQSVPTTTGGSVQMKFDKTHLELVTAEYNNGEIVWTFNSLQTGNTQVILTIGGGIATYVMSVVYDVSVVVLDQANSNAGGGATLSFLGMVNIGLRKIRAKYPSAKLYEVDASSPTPTTNPNMVNQMRIVCQVGNATALIESTGWGEFGPVQYVDKPWLEDVVIPWPISMDLDEATALLKKAGYDGPFQPVTLRWPLYPGVNQPFYIFGMTAGYYVFVGVYDGKVHKEMGSVAMEGTTTPKKRKSSKALSN